MVKAMEKKGAAFNGKQYLNPVHTEVMSAGAMRNVLLEYLKPHPGRMPSKPLGPFTTDRTALYQWPQQDVQVTWLGHSTVLLSIDGKRFLTDPVWYQRVSPFTGLGPKRFFQVPVSLHHLPPIDFILLSHDHYDHFDKTALRFLMSKNIPVITMLGVGKRLRNMGIPAKLITELDWWQEVSLSESFRATALPARHFSGRSLTDRFTTLWGSFALQGPKHSVYYGADSGYYDGFKTIGDAFGPFDLAMLEIGAYNTLWEDVHMGPESAAQACLDVKGNLLLPLHWGTFALAFHPWKEPIERMLIAAEKKDIPLLVPAPGETRVVSSGAYVNQWWKV
jgi:L-ascorbate metabolism protein UlaG (beta-lactamase superfamily)